MKIIFIENYCYRKSKHFLWKIIVIEKLSIENNSCRIFFLLKMLSKIYFVENCMHKKYFCRKLFLTQIKTFSMENYCYRKIIYSE